MTRVLLRGIAVIDVAAGVFLMLTTWDRLYDSFGLSAPDQAVFAQTAGAFLIAMGYLLWIAPRSPALTAAVAAGSALGHAMTAALSCIWLVVDGATMPAHQVAALTAVGLTCALIALSGAMIARRDAATLLPPD